MATMEQRSKLEERKNQLKAMRLKQLREVQIGHGLRDYKGDAEKINFKFHKRSLRQLMTLDIIRHEFPEFIASLRKKEKSE